MLLQQAADVSSGILLTVIAVPAIATWPISLGLLRLYRNRVVSGMTHSVTRPVAPVSRPPLDTDRVPETPLQFITETKLHAPLLGVANRRSWQAAAIYGVAGLVCCVIIVAGALVAGGDDFLLIQKLIFTWAMAWPVVLTVNIVAAASTKERRRSVAIYFLAVLPLLVWAALRGTPLSDMPPLLLAWFLINALPTGIVFLILARRIRAVGPLVFSFLLLCVAGGIGTLELLAASTQLQRGLSGVAYQLGVSAGMALTSIIVGGIILLTPLAYVFGRVIGKAYERKLISDQSATLDALWLLFATSQSLGPMSNAGSSWVLLGAAGFVGYRLAVAVGFRMLHRRAPGAAAPKLLLLRGFSLGKRSERLYDAIAKKWRYLGSVQLLAGPDLATSTVDPDEFLDFLHGQAHSRFIDSQATLEKKLGALDVQVDHDGRYRVTEFFCHADTWRAVLIRLARSADAILLDLRGFTRQHNGLIFEVRELIHSVDLRRVVLVVDSTTDDGLLRETALRAWSEVPPGSVNATSASPSLRLLRHTEPELDGRLQPVRALCAAIDDARTTTAVPVYLHHG